LVLTFLKPLLPIGVISFGVLALTGCGVYALAAFAFDIAGLRKAVIAYGARRNLWPAAGQSNHEGHVLPAASATAASTGLPSMSAREP